MKRKAGKLLMTIGLLLIAAAFLLMVYNIWESKKAENMSEEILNPVSYTHLTLPTILLV